MKPVLALLLAAVSLAARGDEVEWQVPFITTPEEVVERMLELAGTRAGDLVADLGSGDGRIVIMAAKKFGARGLGIELDQRLVDQARDNARAAGVAERVSFVQGDVLSADFSKASVVTVYLLPGLIGQLQPRFTELRPGTRIVSHAFGMAGWAPDKTGVIHLHKSHRGQGDESRLFLWIVPADIRGVWRGDGRRYTIDQNYQQLDVDGVSGRVSGVEVSWGDFRGRVVDNRIVGELAGKPLVLTR